MRIRFCAHSVAVASPLGKLVSERLPVDAKRLSRDLVQG